MRSTASPVLVAVAAAAMLLAAVVAPFVVLPLLAVLGVLVLAARRHDQPVTAEVDQWSGRWHVWIGVAVALFAVGWLPVAFDDPNDPDDLSFGGWWVWILSWLAAAVAAVVGAALRANRRPKHHHA